MKRRWMLGNYELNINPKAYSATKSAFGSTSVSVNGLVTVNNPFFEKDIDFTFDVYQKPSLISKAPFISFANPAVFLSSWMTANITATYSAIAERRTNQEYFLLKNTTIEVYNQSGIYLRQFNANTVAGATPVGMTVTDDKVIVFYNNRTLVIQDEINTEYVKYTYSDIDLSNVTSIVFNYDTNDIYALNKYGKIFLLQDNAATSQMIYQFGDFTANQSANKGAYECIHIVNGYIGVMKDDYQLFYMSNVDREIVHAVELLEKKSISGISYGDQSKQIKFLGKGKVYNAQIDLCGIDIDIIKGQLTNGVITITDESNVTKFVAISKVDIRRLRNKQDARFEVSFSGKVM